MKPFYFNWSAFSFWPGIKFLVAALLLFLLSTQIEFTWFLVGLSAFLAWLVAVVSGPRRNKETILIYLIAGTMLTACSNLLTSTYWTWAIFMFVVAFLGTVILRYGTHWYILGWGLVYWILLTPTLNDMGSGFDITLSHAVGSGIILLLLYVEDFWMKKKGEAATDPLEKQELVPWNFAALYALIMAFVVVGALMIGYRYLKTDITLIANAAYMIVGFSINSTWKAGLERILAALTGIVAGFYLGVYMQNELFGLVMGIVFIFMAFNCLFVNNGIIVFLFLGAIGYSYGLKGLIEGNELANERIVAEAAGIMLAGVGISVLRIISKAFAGSKRQ